jgi:hypothetical protein
VGFAALSPPYKNSQTLSQLKLHLRIFAVVSSISGRAEATPAAFHVKFSHAKQIEFQGLSELHESIRRSRLTFVSVTTNCATVSLSKGAF